MCQTESTKDTTMTPEPVDATTGSHDSDGAADHDVLFRFGRPPTAERPYPFSTRQYARLLVLRSQLQAGIFGAGDC
jgi:hypothetical protein